MSHAEKLVGSWHLRGWQISYSDSDRVTYPFGNEPHGLLVYSADGWMSAAINRGERQPMPGGRSPRNLPLEILADAYMSYFHYAGTYRVEGDSVIHSVTQSLNPNFPGSEQVRQLQLQGDTLILLGEEPLAERIRYHELTWSRGHPD